MANKRNIGGKTQKTKTKKNIISNNEDKILKNVINDIYNSIQNNLISNQFQLKYTSNINPNFIGDAIINSGVSYNDEIFNGTINNTKKDGSPNTIKPDGGMIYLLNILTNETIPLLIVENKHQESLLTCLKFEKKMPDTTFSWKGYYYNEEITDIDGFYIGPNIDKLKSLCKNKGDFYINSDGKVYALTTPNTNEFKYMGKETGGNALERITKNFDALKDLGHIYKWFPYVIFVSGIDFSVDYILGKLISAKVIINKNRNSQNKFNFKPYKHIDNENVYFGSLFHNETYNRNIHVNEYIFT